MLSTLLALGLVAQPEPAQPVREQDNDRPSEQISESQKEEGKVKDKRICRRITAGMGSRKKERVCMTRDEWREFNRGN